MNTKIFCDIAELNQIKKFHKKNIVKGFTTNPSLMRKAGAKDYENYSKKIINICKDKPISFEVFADDNKSMISQGKKISTWGKNVYVKVPIVNSKNIFDSNAKELKALKNIYNTSEEITNDPIAKKEISDQIDHLERRLSNTLKGITQSTDLTWIHNSRRLNIKNHLDIQAELSRILKDIYSESPILKNELINRDNISAQGQSARTRLIKMMASQRHDPNLGYELDKYPPDKTIFNAIFKQLDLYQKESVGYKFAYPKKGTPLYPAYEYIKRSLSSSEPKSYAQLCEGLSLPPIGIKKGMHPVIFFGFYYSVEANMAMYEDGIFIPYLNDEAVDRIVRKGDHFAFQLHTFSGQDKLIRAYSEQFLQEESKNILTIVRAFSRQMKALPEFTQQTRNLGRISNEAIKLRSSFDLLRRGLPERPPDRSAFEETTKLLFSTVVLEAITPSKLKFLILLVISEIISIFSSGDNFIKIGFEKFSLSRASFIALNNGKKFSLECRDLNPGVFGEEILTAI